MPYRNHLGHHNSDAEVLNTALFKNKFPNSGCSSPGSAQ